MAKILVTGGAGFIGSNLSDRLIKQGNQIVIIDNLSSGKEEYINPEAKFYKADICSDEIGKIFEKELFDYVFHLAGQIDVRKSLEDPRFDCEINVFGGLNILQNCHKHGIQKIIFSSTGGAIYGDTDKIPTNENEIAAPVSPYGIHKLNFEKYLNFYHKIYGQDYTALRFANVYGPRQYKGGETGVISIFIDNAIKGNKNIIYGDGLQTRDFVHVDDVVEAMIMSMNKKFPGEINIGTGKETNLLEIIKSIESALGEKIKFEYGSSRKGEQLRSCLDIKLAKDILNWSPKINLDKGVKNTIERSIKDIKNNK